MNVNARKLKSLGFEKVCEACNRHAAAYHRYKAAGNTALMAAHRRLLDVCGLAVVQLSEEHNRPFTISSDKPRRFVPAP